MDTKKPGKGCGADGGARKKMMEIQVKKLREGAVLPTRATELSAGADLYACPAGDTRILPGETVLIPTGIAVAIPAGYAGFIYARSGLSTKQGLAPANKVGVIDADYRGEVCVSLYNQSGQVRIVSPGDRIAQLVIQKVETPAFCEVETLPETKRGAGGFGSTGK